MNDRRLRRFCSAVRHMDLRVEKRADVDTLPHDHGYCLLRYTEEHGWGLSSEHWTWFGAFFRAERLARGDVSVLKWLLYPDGLGPFLRVSGAALLGGLLGVAWMVAVMAVLKVFL